MRRHRLEEELFPFMGRLSAAARRELEEFTARQVGPRAPLLRRGDPAGGAYLVVRGVLRVYYVTTAGKEATLYRVEAGGTCILALAAVFKDEPYPAWVEAGTQGGWFVHVPSDVVRRLLDREAPFRDFVFGALSGRILELMGTLEETGSAQVEERVARYLVRRRALDGTVRVSQVGIASELGTAREVVFRALRSLSGRGLIETGRMRVTIRDLEGLRRVGEEPNRRGGAAARQRGSVDA